MHAKQCGCLLVWPGGMYEYIIEPASRSAAPCLEKRAAKLAGAVAAQVEEIRRQANRMDLTPPPGVKTVRGNRTAARPEELKALPAP